MSDREPGFAALLAAGKTPLEAWQILHDDLIAEPGALEILTDAGEETLAWGRAQWARWGLRPPWEDSPT